MLLEDLLILQTRWVSYGIIACTAVPSESLVALSKGLCPLVFHLPAQQGISHCHYVVAPLVTVNFRSMPLDPSLVDAYIYEQGCYFIITSIILDLFLNLLLNL